MLPGNSGRPFYAEVLLPLPLDNPVYSYRSSEEAAPGALCIVPFGNGARHVGLVLSSSREAPPSPAGKEIRYKGIERFLPLPPVSPEALKVWKWAAEYHLCSPGDILRAALPRGIERYSGREEFGRVWGVNPRLFGDGAFRENAAADLGRKKLAIAFLEEAASNPARHAARYPSLKALAKGLRLSSHTIEALREAGVVIELEEPAEGLPSALPPERPRRPGAFSIKVVVRPFSKEEERLPRDFLREAMERGEGQVLLLFPNREALLRAEPGLKAAFGEKLFPYHSGISRDKERERSYSGALKGRPGIYYGLRAAVWLPFAALSAVVVTDEEDRGYRQFEPAPRFTASNVALMLAKAFGAETLLTTASPSVETAMNALLLRKYSFEELPPSPAPNPGRLILADMDKAFERDDVSARMLSGILIREMMSALGIGGSVLLYFQRQGYARFVSCSRCHEALKCPVCGTAYRYFGRGKNNLVCPACGHFEPKPATCPYCGHPSPELVGTGSERLLEAVRRYFTGTPVRLSSSEDSLLPEPGAITISTGYEPSAAALRAAALIGIVQWDLLELRPDFRATERSYRFMMKVLSEAPPDTRVVAQFFRPYGTGLKAILARNYRQLFDEELEARFQVGFSPFSRQIDAVILSGNASDAYRAALKLSEETAGNFPETRTLGPSPLPSGHSAAGNGYRLTLLVPPDRPLTPVRSFLKAWRAGLLRGHRGSSLFVYFDADPQ